MRQRPKRRRRGTLSACCLCIASAASAAAPSADTAATTTSNNQQPELVLPPPEHMPHKPYAPYSFNQPPLIRPRSARPVNPNAADVVSCGQCCFGPNPHQLSTFLATLPPSSRYHDRLTVSNFYSKVISVVGVPIVSSRDVSDVALQEAALTLVKLSTKQPHLLDILREEAVHIAVIGSREPLTSVPAYASLALDETTDWNAFRGIGATQWMPVSSCAEENLLCLEGDRYRDEHIGVHELAHTLQGSGGKLPTPRYVDFGDGDMGSFDLNERIKMVYQMGKDYLWTNTYAATNHEEMWAEGVQSFYSVNYPHAGPSGDGVHNDIWRRELLEEYHPELNFVIDKVFESSVRFECPPTSLESCDCESLQRMCAIAGVGSVEETDEPSSRPTTTVPTFRPTTEMYSDHQFRPTATSSTEMSSDQHDASEDTAAAPTDMGHGGIDPSGIGNEDEYDGAEINVSEATSSAPPAYVSGISFYIASTAVIFIASMLDVYKL